MPDQDRVLGKGEVAKHDRDADAGKPGARSSARHAAQSGEGEIFGRWMDRSLFSSDRQRPRPAAQCCGRIARQPSRRALLEQLANCLKGEFVASEVAMAGPRKPDPHSVQYTALPSDPAVALRGPGEQDALA